jgi:hypothetical protein
VLQIVGFLGARSLSERLLNVYWLLLLGLLVGDAVLGVYWLYRYDKMVARLKPALRDRLAKDYGRDRRFAAVWDDLQRDHECCGVNGPQDFFNVTVQVGGTGGECARPRAIRSPSFPSSTSTAPNCCLSIVDCVYVD